MGIEFDVKEIAACAEKDSRVQTLDLFKHLLFSVIKVITFDDESLKNCGEWVDSVRSVEELKGNAWFHKLSMLDPLADFNKISTSPDALESMELLDVLQEFLETQSEPLSLQTKDVQRITDEARASAIEVLMTEHGVTFDPAYLPLPESPDHTIAIQLLDQSEDYVQCAKMALVTVAADREFIRRGLLPNTSLIRTFDEKDERLLQSVLNARAEVIEILFEGLHKTQTSPPPTK